MSIILMSKIKKKNKIILFCFNNFRANYFANYFIQIFILFYTIYNIYFIQIIYFKLKYYFIQKKMINCLTNNLNNFKYLD